MKVVMIKGQIINCEEIRNVSNGMNSIYIYFKNSGERYNCIRISTKNKEETNSLLKLIYNEMTSK